MPSIADDTTISGPCKRCGQRDAVVKGRDSLQCAECFIFFVQTKVIKNLTSLAIRESSKGKLHQVLVPVSFGYSSVTLLHILDKHLERQRGKSGRVGYELHVLHVDDGSLAQHGQSPSEYLDKLKSRFPLHKYYLHDPVSAPMNTVEHQLEKSNLARMLDGLSSATSKADVTSLSVQRTIAHLAETLKCSTVLQGFSTTALAERLLSATAKGRGFALPYLSQDGTAAFCKEGVNTVYPLREVLSKETVAFTRVTDPPLMDLIFAAESKAPVSSKNMTIDGLMRDYFAGVEQQYPAIVTNVVRTSERLERPSDRVGKICPSCGTPMQDSSTYWAGEQGGQEGQELESQPPAKNCYGCQRTFEGSKAAD